MSRKPLPNSHVGISYRGEDISIGSAVQNIETDRTYRVVGWEIIGGDTMCRCLSQYHDGSLDDPKDCEWFDPADMITLRRVMSGSALFRLMRAIPDAWIETDRETFDEQLGVVPPTAIDSGRFLGGEPASHNAQGKPFFICIRNIGGRFYAREITYAEYKKL